MGTSPHRRPQSRTPSPGRAPQRPIWGPMITPKPSTRGMGAVKPLMVVRLATRNPWRVGIPEGRGPDLRSLVEVAVVRRQGTQVTSQTRYFISSCPPSAGIEVLKTPCTGSWMQPSTLMHAASAAATPSRIRRCFGPPPTNSLAGISTQNQDLRQVPQGRSESGPYGGNPRNVRTLRWPLGWVPAAGSPDPAGCAAGRCCRCAVPLGVPVSDAHRGLRQQLAQLGDLRRQAQAMH